MTAFFQKYGASQRRDYRAAMGQRIAVAVALWLAVAVSTPGIVHPTTGDGVLRDDRPGDARDGELHLVGEVIWQERREAFSDRR